MKSEILIDSHKLIYHPEAVSNWLKGDNIYPIELEISPSSACNHRCIFCAVDYMGYKPVTLEKDLIINMIKQIQPLGLKSVIYSGEGEPLLNKDMSEILNKTKENKVDASMSSNGVLFHKEFSKEALHALTWVRFSISAVTPEIYGRIHTTKESDIDIVLNNLEEAVKVKKDQNLRSTIGAQLLLIPENIEDVVKTAKALKKVGIDYFSVKPYSQHPDSKNHIEINYDSLLDLEVELKEFQTDDFSVFFRAEAMKKKQVKRNYCQCYGLPFMAHVDTLGNIWPCIAFMGKSGFSYGNLYENSFKEIWEGETRKNIINEFSKMNLEENCRELCRLDEINRYLHRLKNPMDHVNFI